MRSVERALAASHIPYVLLGGIGFYQTQEVFDLLNYFKFLLHPGDDVALAGVLRSPFHAVSDAELFEISLVNKGETFWEKTTLYAGRAAASPALRRAVAALSHHLECANRLTIPFLAERILRQTGWRGTMSGLSAGAQYAANVKKLLRMARSFEARGYSSLFDFVERLKTLVSEQEREGQASVTPHDNCVQVMTIHSAKGLEFPVVFLPFAHKSFGADLPPHIDADAGIGIRTRERSGSEAEVVPALYAYLERRSRERVENEEKRIFYVACTRARDALLISGCRGKRTPAPSYLSWLEQGLRGLIASGPPAEEVGGPGSVEPALATLRWYSGQEARRAGAAEGSGARPRPKTLLIEPLRARISGEFYSATHIKTYLECPSKYYLKYILGLPEEHAPLYAAGEEEEDTEKKLFPQAEGIITHAALQELKSSSSTDEEIAGRVRELARPHAAGASALSQERVGAIVRSIAGFRDSPFGRELLSAEEAFTECPIQSAFEGDFLTGTIDRLYKREGGEWSIVDYKTDRVDRGELSSRGEVYRPQLLLYAFLVSRLYRQEKVRATLLFLQHPELPLHYDFSPEQFTSYEGTLRSVISRIQSHDFRRDPPLCDGCPYRSGSGCLIPFQERGKSRKSSSGLS